MLDLFIIQNYQNSVMSSQGPFIHLPLSAYFCSQILTIRFYRVFRITQDQVDAGVVFTEALERHQKWLADHGLLDGTKSFIFVTCGDWDLRQMMPPQCKTSGVKVPSPYCKWINIKFPFCDKYNTKPLGMAGMLRRLDMNIQGRHHSGIDDCRNIARIMKRMLEEGVVFKQTSYHAPKEVPESKPKPVYGQVGGQVRFLNWRFLDTAVFSDHRFCVART
jgi:inhibitor of KinA sporulation pathway (predicted exonuclease)